jgi:copper homeostasis protein
LEKIVEICVESAEGAIAAWRGGAKRVEICRDRGVGGVTPEPSEIARACRELGIPVHVLIRPRPGDFVYDRDELARMSAGISLAGSLGASGVVLGVLLSDGRIDQDRMAALVTRADGLSVTFHKAFDLTPDPFQALDTLIALKIDRVLTSGQAPTALKGAKFLGELVRHAAGKITILAGGSLGFDDLPAMNAAGLAEIHSGSAVEKAGRTDEARVRQLVRAWRDRVDPSLLAE